MLDICLVGESYLMSQLTIKVSAKADALIAQLQKEIFNRRRKKITAEGVVESLVESGAKSQSDKRFATSWKNLIKDIEKAAKISEVHGNKPSNLTEEEWAIVLSHRTRKASTTSRKTPVKRVAKTKAKKTSEKTSEEKKTLVKKAAPAKKALTTKTSVTKRIAKATTSRPARRASSKSPAGNKA